MTANPADIPDRKQLFVRRQRGLRVATAKAAWVNIPELLVGTNGLQEFVAGRMRACGQESFRAQQETEVVSDWIVDVAAIMSEAQLRSAAVSQVVRTEGDAIPLFRPPMYGRAGILKLDEHPYAGGVRGILDIKGCGVQDTNIPIAVPHRSGLMFLPEAIKDLITQKIVDRALAYAGVDVRGVPVYAIISLGFDGWYSERQSGPMPAAIMVRKVSDRNAHLSRQFDPSADAQRTLWRIELILRRFGITSAVHVKQPYIPFPALLGLSSVCNVKGECEVAHMNVQTSAEFSPDPLAARLYDFDQYKFRERFDCVVSSWDTSLGHALWPEEEGYVQPDPELQVATDHIVPGKLPRALEQWSGGPPDREWEEAWCLAVELAYLHCCERMTPQEMAARIDAYVLEVLPLGGFQGTH